MSKTVPTHDHAVVEPAPDAPAEPDRPGPGLTRSGRVKRTRAGAWWTGLVTVAVVSILFLVFIVQNAGSVTVRFLNVDGQLSLAVALLLSAALGAIVVAVPGMARIAQLRHALRRAGRAQR